MKTPYLTLIFLWLALTAGAQKVTRTYRGTPLPRVLADLDDASKRYTINFIYDELEDFTVTADIRNRTIPEALQEAVGFYPMRITLGDSLIFVECTQKAENKMTGRLVGPDRLPIAYANVALLNPSDSCFINGGVSNDGGDFVIPCDHAGKVLLRVSYVGYRTFYRLSDVGQQGTMVLTPETHTLAETRVKAARKVIRSDVDRLQYLVSNDPFATGMNGIEVMARVPMLNVNDETVSIVGKSTTHFMLDGRILEMSDEGVKAKLRSLKAEDIERIEVITIPPAKYKAEANGGYVNIVTRRDQTQGWSGSLTAGVQHQYREHFWPQAAVNYASKKIEMSATASFANVHNINKRRTVYTFDDGHQRTVDDTGISYWPMGDASFIMKYLASQRLQVGVMANINADRLRTERTGTIIETDTTRSTGHTPGQWNTDLSTTLYADYRLDSLGKTMSVNYNYFRANGPLENTNISVTNGVAESLRSSSHARYQIHALKLDFELPFKSFYMEAGAAATLITNHTGIDIDNLTSGVSPDDPAAQWTRNTNESNTFNYREQGLAAYLSARHPITKQLQMQAGLRYEYTWTRGHQVTNGQIDHNHYGRFFPTLHLSWQPKEGHAIGVAVSYGIDRPQFGDMNPFRAYSDARTYVTGNPYLTAAYTRNSEINYNNGKGLYLVLYNDHGTNEVGFNVEFKSDGTQVSSPVNGVSHDKTGLYATYNRNVLKWMNVNAEGEVYYHDAHSDGRANLQPMHGWGKRLGTTLLFMLNKQQTAVAEVAYEHTFTTYYSMRRMLPQDRLNLALRSSWLQDRLKLRLAVGDPFRWLKSRTEARYTGFSSTQTFDYHASYASIRATWSFGGKQVKQVYHDNRDTESKRAGK